LSFFLKKKKERIFEELFSLSMMVFKKRCFSSLFVVVVCFLFVFLWWFEKKREREREEERTRESFVERTQTREEYT
jgi:hypothetical protein